MQGGVTSALEVTSIGTICDLDVKLDIRHAWDEDLDVNLVGPDGTEVLLFSDVGGMGDNFSCTVLDDDTSLAITEGSPPFTGRYRAEGSLSHFNGKSMTGTWVLKIADDEELMSGMLNSWSPVIVGAEPCVCFPSEYSTYNDWVALGKPACWCSPPDGTGYQCDGDADGVTSGFPFNYRVFTGDLALVVNNWQKRADDRHLIRVRIWTTGTRASRSIIASSPAI